MQLILIVLVILTTLVLDVIGTSFKSILYTSIGGLVSMYGLARLAQDNSLTIQSQLNPSTGLYVDQTAAATTAEFQLTLVVLAIFAIMSFMIVINMVFYKEGGD